MRHSYFVKQIEAQKDQTKRKMEFQRTDDDSSDSSFSNEESLEVSCNSNLTSDALICNILEETRTSIRNSASYKIDLSRQTVLNAEQPESKMEWTLPEVASFDSLLRPSLDEPAESGTLLEKSQLTDEPLIYKQQGVKYNKGIPPPYEVNPSQQPVWTIDVCSQTSRVNLKKHQIVCLNFRRFRILSHLLILIITIMGIFLSFNGVSSVLANYETARKIRIVTNEALQAINIVDDINNIPAEYEGKLIHVTGNLSVADSLKYDECGISVPSVKLRRIFDISHIYTRKSGNVPYFMSEKWPQTRLGKELICQRQYIGFSTDDNEQIADEAKIGPLKLGRRLKEKFDEFYVVSENLIVVDEFTAVRAMYSYAGRNLNVHSVLGQLVNGTIEPYELLDYYTIILHTESEVPADIMIKDRAVCRLRQLDKVNCYSYTEIGVGVLLPLIAILHYNAVAGKKIKRKNLNIQTE